MEHKSRSHIALGATRREWLRLSAGALLSAGLWPGCARFAGNGRGDHYVFAVMNDPHFQSPRCPAWFERVTTSLRSHDPRPDFCLVVGDLSNAGAPGELGGMRDVLRSLGMAFYTVIGNHDYTEFRHRRVYEELFPRSLNYHFEHRGWQFIGLDSTEGAQYENTRVPPSTLNWLDSTLPRLNPAQPTVLFTHFPLGAGVKYRPLDADDLLARFLPFNLVAVFNGHFHGMTERLAGATVLTTNACCAVSRENHDGTTAKGYFLCAARGQRIQRRFVEVRPA